MRTVRILGAETIMAPSYDESLLWASLTLLGLGLVMVYSASAATAAASSAQGYNSYYYLIRQLIYIMVALSFSVLAFKCPIDWWQKMAPYLFLLGLLLLVLVLIPGIGHVAGGGRRWLTLLVVNLQPSELVKLFTALYVADYTVRKAKKMQSIRHGFLPVGAVIFLVSALLMLEPDFGAFLVIALIALGILWVGGINEKIFVSLIGVILISALVLVVLSPYRMERVTGFINPWADPYGKGYQLTHALIAFGRGGWLGVGMGASVEKLLYLPEAHTDFLLAIIAEELGFLGVATVIALFTWIVWRAFSIAQEAMDHERYFASLLAQGLGTWLGVQGMLNMGVNMGLLPTKGLTLPLLSFGGSSIVANCVALAILLRIDSENRCLNKGGVL